MKSVDGSLYCYYVECVETGALQLYRMDATISIILNVLDVVTKRANQRKNLSGGRAVMKKTSKRDFDKFKAEFLHWVDEFGLVGYRLIFDHTPTKDSHADIIIDEEGKLAVICLSSILNPDFCGAEEHAKHEALHLLLSRLEYLGGLRYARDGEIKEESEKLIRILQKLL